MLCPRCAIDMQVGEAIHMYTQKGNVCTGFGIKEVKTAETLRLIKCLKCPTCDHSDNMKEEQ